VKTKRAHLVFWLIFSPLFLLILFYGVLVVIHAGSEERLQKKYEVIPQIVRDGGVMGGHDAGPYDAYVGFQSESKTFSLDEVVLSFGFMHMVHPSEGYSVSHFGLWTTVEKEPCLLKTIQEDLFDLKYYTSSLYVKKDNTKLCDFKEYQEVHIPKEAFTQAEGSFLVYLTPPIGVNRRCYSDPNYESAATNVNVLKTWLQRCHFDMVTISYKVKGDTVTILQTEEYFCEGYGEALRKLRERWARFGFHTRDIYYSA